MSAEVLDLEKYLKERKLLKEVLPLEYPFTCNVLTANACNFKCFYCVNSDLDKKKAAGVSNDMLSYQDFVSIADHISSSGKLKKLIFTGVGEPLLNKEITQMFQYAKEKQIAEQVEVVTNGACLTKELCEAVVESGLDRIRISLNGLSEEDFRNNCGVDLNYKAFQSNLKYLYEYRSKHNKNIQIYIKIMDVMVEDENKKKQFYEEYSPICDEIFIEGLIPVNNITYEDNPEQFTKNFWGEELGKERKLCKVCSQPFYNFVVGTQGEFYPCCQIPMPASHGNLLEQTLSDIWNSKEYHAFLISLLNGSFKELPVCATCRRYEFMTLESDRLDGSEELLIEKYKKLGENYDDRGSKKTF